VRKLKHLLRRMAFQPYRDLLRLLRKEVVSPGIWLFMRRPT
jgi:hypothetical protein